MIAQIPHEPPIRLVQNMDWVEWPAACASMFVPEDSPYVNDGLLCPEMFIELMAQCFAGACGARYGKHQGFLAGIRSFNVAGLARVGDRLRAVCEMDRSIAGIWLVNGKIYKIAETGAQTPLLASAELRIYVPEGDFNCE